MNGQATTFNLGGVNCYLVECAGGFVLIDTGLSTKRALLLRSIQDAGCMPGNLRFVLITHGDADHAGNAAFLQQAYRTPIGMHPDDFGMVERGDMSWNRKRKADRMSPMMKIIGAIVRLVAKQRFETFKPDVEVVDGFDLSPYGLPGKVVHIPGHSKGSIGVLLDNGNLYCGDFLYTTPGMNFVDDLKARMTSLERLRKLPVKKVFPGHGRPISAVR